MQDDSSVSRKKRRKAGVERLLLDHLFQLQSFLFKNLLFSSINLSH